MPGVIDVGSDFREVIIWDARNGKAVRLLATRPRGSADLSRVPEVLERIEREMERARRARKKQLKV